MTKHLSRRSFAAVVMTWMTAMAVMLVDGGAASSAENQSREAASIVITVDSPLVRKTGEFQTIPAYLSRSARVLRSAGPGTSIRFAPAIDEPGFYRVHVWWPQSVPGAGNVDILVHHSRGMDRLGVNQAIFGGQWNLLGVYELAPGGGVEIANRGEAVALADAVRFEYVGRVAPELAVASSALPLAEAGRAYAAKIDAAGGIGPYGWRLSQGSLPAGLTLDTRTGVVAGTPAQPGARRFTIAVLDGQGREAERAFSIQVLQTAAAPSTPKALTFDAARKQAQEGPPAAAPPDLSVLLDLITAQPEGEWSKVNLNNYSDVWTPDELRPLLDASNPPPSKIIEAWSGFAWDSNRGDLLLYGGGHANYSGNDVYRWRGTTRQWERASLPSEVKQDDLLNWIAVDGPDAAPASAHTYRNNIFLPLIDRLVVFGGAANANGGPYMRQATATTSRPTGPYFFDPSKADPNKVGGTTGSHVQRVSPHPEVVGGNMWSNRDIQINIPGSPSIPGSHINGCTAYARENGKDVVYLVARGSGGGTGPNLYKYSVNTLADATQDTMEQVGMFAVGTDTATACGFDATAQVLFRIGQNSIPFLYWDLSTAGASNPDVRVTPTDPSGEFATLLTANSVNLNNCGLDFDPTRRRYLLWCGDGRVWAITAPSPLSATGWTIIKQPAPTLATPNGDVGTGILGKWKYIDNLDAFMGLQDAVLGNIWVYKPVGWQDPRKRPNLAPTVSLTSPADGASFAFGASIGLAANASDVDGGISKVEFFADGAKIGESLSPPYAFTWAGAPAGTHSLTAVATDNTNAQTASAPVAITVQSPSVPPSTPSPSNSSGGGGGGGGGCAIAPAGGEIDVLLPLLIAVAGFWLRRRRAARLECRSRPNAAPTSCSPVPRCCLLAVSADHGVSLERRGCHQHTNAEHDLLARLDAAAGDAVDTIGVAAQSACSSLAYVRASQRSSHRPGRRVVIGSPADCRAH